MHIDGGSLAHPTLHFNIYIASLYTWRTPWASIPGKSADAVVSARSAASTTHQPLDRRLRFEVDLGTHSRAEATVDLSVIHNRGVCLCIHRGWTTSCVQRMGSRRDAAGVIVNLPGYPVLDAVGRLGRSPGLDSAC